MFFPYFKYTENLLICHCRKILMASLSYLIYFLPIFLVFEVTRICFFFRIILCSRNLFSLRIHLPIGGGVSFNDFFTERNLLCHKKRVVIFLNVLVVSGILPYATRGLHTNRIPPFNVRV